MAQFVNNDRIIQYFPQIFVQESENIKWNFLNGYRGLLALWVVITHSNHPEYNDPILIFINGMARIVAVDGFFVLSSFLLTYRLLKDLIISKSDTNNLVILLKYAIRRIFRIYLVIIIYLFLFILLNKMFGFKIDHIDRMKNETWFQIFTLERPSFYIYPLWTIPVEIKYYFCIPFICVLFVFFYRIFDSLSILFGLFLFLSIWNEFFNILDITGNDLVWFDFKKTGILKNRFPVFLYGSLAGIAMNIIESNKGLINFIKNNLIQKIIKLTTFGMIYYVLRFRTIAFYPSLDKQFNYESIPAFIWSIVIVLMILGHPNFITNFLSKSVFLTSCGKYSFGIYIWHVPVIEMLMQDRYAFVFLIKSKIEHIIYSILISFLVGYLFFCIIEDPLMKIANNLCKKIDNLLNKSVVSS